MAGNGKRTARNRIRIGAACAVAALLAAGLYLTFGRGPARPSVILISIDSLRPDHLGCYGYHRETSPVLDRLAREGTLFETAVSSTSWTLPAHAALFTALPDRVHGCFDDTRWLDRSRFTLAEAFKEAGYKTVGFFAGPFLHPGYGFAQGFDSYHDCTSYSKKTIDMLKRGEVDGDWGGLSHKDITNSNVLREVTAWLEKNPGGPSFVFIHLWDVHYDYIPPPPYDTLFDPGYSGPVDGKGVVGVHEKPAPWGQQDIDHLKALYDGEIRWTDDTLGKLLGAFRRCGALEDTVVAVTADHGEAFYEHGGQGHRYTLYGEEIRIPLVIHYPPSVPAGMRIRPPVHITDIAPTLLDLAGLPPLPHALGRSLKPLIRDPAAPWSDTDGICELMVPAGGIELFALRRSGWKLIIDLARGSHEVFDLARDPGESRPLAEEDYPISKEALKKLYVETARRLQRALEALPAIGERDTLEFSKLNEAQLRSLGYLK